MEFDTAEGQRIRVVVLTTGLKFPWGLTFLPDGTMLVTERTGQLRIIRNGKLDPQPVSGGPTAYFAGESGMPGAVHGYMEIALHPKFAENRYVYLSYTKPLDEKRRTVGIARAKFDGKALTEVKDIFVLDQAGRARLAFGRDGMLYITSSGGDSEGSELPAESRRPGRQGPSPSRRRQHPARQPVRGKGRRQARGLHDRTPQPARTRRASDHRSDLVQ